MTARQIITIDFSEIDKVEVACGKCKAGLILPTTTEATRNLQTHYDCIGCGETLWNGKDDQRYISLISIVRSLAIWKALEGRPFKISLSVDSQ